MIADEKRVEAALHFLSESELDHANAKGLVSWLEAQAGIVRAEAFRQAMADGPSTTVAMAEAMAKTSQGYRDTVDKLRDAITQESLLRAKRDRAQITVDLFRTLSANRRG